MASSPYRLALGLSALACAALPGAGCSSHKAPSAEAVFVVPASLSELEGARFYDHPFPSDLRREADGSVRYEGFHNPFQLKLLDAYIRTSKGLLPGFSPAAAGHLRFKDAIDPASLPADPTASLSPGASVQLVDVDPASPEVGTRKLVQTRWRATEGIYVPARTLAVMPALGYPLRPKTTYAIVVTTALRAQGGGDVVPSADLQEILGARPGTPRTAKLRDMWAKPIEALEKAGVPRARIAHLAVFTTGDPTGELLRVADHAKKAVPAPQIKDLTPAKETKTHDVYEGHYGPVPSYQAGALPFSQNGDGGGFAFEPDGTPKVASTFDMRFTLVIPKATACPEPPNGYPIVLYAHGTGGDFRSLTTENVAATLAGQCLAAMGTDQIFHGVRPGAPPPGPNQDGDTELLFFNLNNLTAARTNNRQSGIDVLMQARAVRDGKLEVPETASRTQKRIKIDASRMTFFGHSQGGLNGPLYLAIDDSARGGVLSGAGSFISVAVLAKTKPQPSVAAAFQTLLSLKTDEEKAELDMFHPVSALIQALIDTTDPAHYMRLIVKEPRPGFAPKSVLMTEGIAEDGTGDNYTPPLATEAGAVALGLPLLQPAVRDVEIAAWSKLEPVALPQRGNLANGRATGGLAQFAPSGTSDGHFVVFTVPEARALYSKFLRTLSDDGKGQLGN